MKINQDESLRRKRSARYVADFVVIVFQLTTLSSCCSRNAKAFDSMKESCSYRFRTLSRKRSRQERMLLFSLSSKCFTSNDQRLRECTKTSACIEGSPEDYQLHEELRSIRELQNEASKFRTGETEIILPDWLQQDLRTLDLSSKEVKEETEFSDALVQLCESSNSLPPWLEAGNRDSVCPTTADVSRKVCWFEYALLHHGFTVKESTEIVQTLYEVVSEGNNVDDFDADQLQLTMGILDFCELLLQVDSETMAYTTSSSNTCSNTTMSSSSAVGGIVTVSILKASIVHYAECMKARRKGLHTIVSAAILRQQNELPILRAESLPKATKKTEKCETDASEILKTDTNSLDYLNDRPAITRREKKDHQIISSDQIYKSTINEEALLIAEGAARLKRAEILAEAVTSATNIAVASNQRDLGDNHPNVLAKEADYYVPLRPALSPDAIQTQQGLLLSVMDDWRALFIRCVAALYRLDGILKYQQQQQLLSSGNFPAELGFDDDNSKKNYFSTTEALQATRTPEVVQTARAALRIYGTLAQRLGMYPLKAMIEERAFRVLYPRQYDVVSSLYGEQERIMERLSKYLQTQIIQRLHSDNALMAQLDDLQVTSRVKEPFSFWKKMLKQKLKVKKVEANVAKPISFSSPSNLDLKDVQDGIAVRVILRARKWLEDESDGSIRARERLLCYHVQNAIRADWPEIDPSRIKDYIQNPKGNGYRSLHHTSSIRTQDMDFPFEVQVRSEEMHNSAEFGLAAHWDYKLGSTPVTPKIGPSKAYDEDSNVATVAKNENSNNLPTSKLRISSEETAVNDSSSLCGTNGKVQGNARRSANLETASYLDALETARQEIIEEQVYVFLVGNLNLSNADGLNVSGGHLVSLTCNSRVRDALAAVDGQLKERWPIVKRNGMVADLDDSIQNGDILTISSSELDPEFVLA